MTEEKTLDTLHNAVSSLRETLENKNANDAETKAQMQKVQDDLDKHEKKNQELVRKQAEEEKKSIELKETVKELESKMSRMNDISADSEAGQRQASQAEHKALTEFCQKGRFSDTDMEKKYLRTDSNVDGGFLMRDEFDNEMLKPLAEISVLRPWCKGKRISTLGLQLASRETRVSMIKVGEGEAEDQVATNSTYGSPRVDAHGFMLITDATNESLMAPAWNLQNEIMSDFVEAREEGEGSLFVNGTGSQEPFGFVPKLVTAGNTFNSESAATYDFDSLILLSGELKKGYNPMYGFNRQEAAFIRTLKDDAGGYAWQPGNMQAGIQNTIGGYSYLVLPDMADKGANAYPVMFADFRKLYLIVDALEAIMLRNDKIKRGKVEFTQQFWLGGDVVQAEAGVLLKCAVS